MDTAKAWHINLNVEKLLGRAEKHNTRTRREGRERQRAWQERLGSRVSRAYSHGFWPANRINLAGESHSFWPPNRN